MDLKERENYSSKSEANEATKGKEKESAAA
jgi:hypothetical protein